MGWVDTTMLVIVGISVLVGLWRGLVLELLAVAGWVAAFLAAQTWAPEVGAQLPIGVPGSAFSAGIGFALVFIGVLMAWSVAARLVRLLVRATPLTVTDRVLGAGFGILRAALLLLAVTTVVTFTPAARSAAWQQSHGAGWLGQMLHSIKPALPPDLARYFPN